MYTMLDLNSIRLGSLKEGTCLEPYARFDAPVFNTKCFDSCKGAMVVVHALDILVRIN